jgi:hypothetical protein
MVHPPLAYRRRAFSWREMLHPFAQHRAPASGSESTIFRCAAAGVLHALSADHVVQGRIIFPGAGYLEMARAAGATALRAAYFVRPLALETPNLLVECAVSGGRFEVRSGEADAVEMATVHCSGATAGDKNASQRVDCASLRAPSRAADVGALYDGFDAVGLQYGPGYRTLVQAWGSVRTALARLHARSTHEGTQVHPADLDDALCTSGVIASSGGDGETQLPFAVDDALLRGARRALWAVRRSSSATQCAADTCTCADLLRVRVLSGRGAAKCRGGRGVAWQQ